MGKQKTILLLVVLIGVVLVGRAFVKAGDSERRTDGDKLAVVWTSSDPEVAYKTCFMYISNAKKTKLFDEIVLIIWGPSARLLAGDKALQDEIKSLMASGVVVQACMTCTEEYGVSWQLRKMGIEVKHLIIPFTEMLKGDWKVLTF